MSDDTASRTPCPKCVVLTYWTRGVNEVPYDATFSTHRNPSDHGGHNRPNACDSLLCVRFQVWVKAVCHDHPFYFDMCPIVLIGGDQDADG